MMCTRYVMRVTTKARYDARREYPRPFLFEACVAHYYCVNKPLKMRERNSVIVMAEKLLITLYHYSSKYSYLPHAYGGCVFFKFRHIEYWWKAHYLIECGTLSKILIGKTFYLNLNCFS